MTVMSKAQYLLLAAFIGFYGVLFAYLLMRAIVTTISARIGRVHKVVGTVETRIKARKRRAWTDAVWHAPASAGQN